MASKDVVLVHGGFVDGSGWEGVYGILRKDGYNVSVVQNPTLSLEGDADATKRIIDAGDPLVSIHKARTKARHTGIEIDTPLVYLWTLRDGKVVHFRAFVDVDQALEAAGLSE